MSNGKSPIIVDGFHSARSRQATVRSPGKTGKRALTRLLNKEKAMTDQEFPSFCPTGEKRGTAELAGNYHISFPLSSLQV